MTLPEVNQLARRIVLPSLLALLVATMAGCGGRGTVSGKVTLHGNPVQQGAMVNFVGPGGAAESFGTPVDAQGQYKMAGLPAKPMKVTVTGANLPNQGVGRDLVVKTGAQPFDIELGQQPSPQP